MDMIKGEIQRLRESFINEPTHEHMGTFEVPIDEDSEVITLGSEEDGPVVELDHLDRDPRPGRLVPHEDAHEYGMDLSDAEVMANRRGVAISLMICKSSDVDLNIESKDEYTLKMIHEALIHISNNVAWYREEYKGFDFSVNDPYIARQMDLIENTLKDFK